MRDRSRWRKPFRPTTRTARPGTAVSSAGSWCRGSAGPNCSRTDRSSDGVAAAVGALAPERLRAARARFTSFGTCSIAEPVEDLVALGLLGAPAPVPEAAG